MSKCDIMIDYYSELSFCDYPKWDGDVKKPTNQKTKNF